MQNRIEAELFAQKDTKYKAFMQSLLPTVDANTILGVRLPILQKMAKHLSKESGIESFLKNLPHTYFEENHLHSFLIATRCQTYPEALQETKAFLPYIDNWAVCDSFRPKALLQNKSALYKEIKAWLHSEEPYTIRFALNILMQGYLKENFDAEILKEIASIHSNEYYVNMAISWYYSMALLEQYEKTIPLFENKILDKWIHNKALQKAIESRKSTPLQKEIFRKLKQK